MPGITELEQKITAIIAARFKLDRALDLHDRFREDLGADSLDLLELVFTLEERLGISVSDADAVPLRTLADVLRYVEARGGVEPAAASNG